MNGDGKAEIIASFNGRPLLSVVDGLSGNVLSSVNLNTLPGVGTAFSQGPRIAARAGRIAIVSGARVAPTLRILAFKALAWSVEPLTQPRLGATGTSGLFIG